jgi:LCP family protein required for cell wall assembly
MISVPRDLWVSMGTRNCSVGYQEKINAVYVCGEETKFHENGYPDGGMGLLTKIIEQNFGIDLNYYARINYTALKQAVDAVGGIDVVIKSEDPRGLYDSNIEKHDGGPLKLTNGPHHLNGQQALNLARARGDGASTYGFASSDFTRTEHQRQMMLALKDKALSVGVLSNPAKVSSLLDAAGDNVQTDFKTNEIRRLYDITKQVSNNNIQSIGLTDKNVQLVTTFTSVKNTSAVRPVAGVTDFSQIKAFIKRLTSNDPVAREGATAVVLNGSGKTGLARTKGDELIGKGVTVKSVDTTKLQTTTAIIAVNTTSKPSTKAYLEQKFGVAVTIDKQAYPVAQNYDADFVIILGQNEQTSSQN